MSYWRLSPKWRLKWKKIHGQHTSVENLSIYVAPPFMHWEKSSRHQIKMSMNEHIVCPEQQSLYEHLVLEIRFLSCCRSIQWYSNLTYKDGRDAHTYTHTNECIDLWKNMKITKFNTTPAMGFFSKDFYLFFPLFSQRLSDINYRWGKKILKCNIVGQ